jgi:hypothetical protein
MQVSIYLSPAAENLLMETPGSQAVIEEIVDALKGYSWKIQEKARAEQLKDFLATIPRIAGWNGPGYRVDGNALPKELAAFVKVDFQSINNSEAQCIYTLEVLSDNKQALPTNLMKFQLASDLAKGDKPHLGIGIAFTSEHSQSGGGGNTSGVGWADLYENALRTLFAKTITTPVILIKIGLNSSSR